MTHLSVEGLAKNFRGIQALDGVSFDVAGGSLHAIIGPNGAGKTTVFNCITGVYQPDSGHVRLSAEELHSRRPDIAARAGIGRTFQDAALFDGMTVLENLLVGSYLAGRTGFTSGALLSRGARKEERQLTDRADEIIERLSLAEVRNEIVSVLPHGFKKRIDLARALVGEPSLVLLDEPMAGLAPEERSFMGRLLQDLQTMHGMTLVMIEHDMSAVMNLADQITVLNFGRKIAEGPPAEVRADPVVIEAYLGVDAEDLAQDESVAGEQLGRP